MDQEIRNKLRNVVTQCRKLLAGDEQNLEKDKGEIRELLEGKYGIFAKKDQVTADPNAKMTHLSEEEQAARKDILDHFAHIKARGFKPKEALDQLVREIAFTHLNRLCAYKMMEAREVYVGGQKFRETVSRGVNSNGVKFYLAEHEDDERLFNTGHQDVAYRHFLDWLGGALSDEIGVLFNPNDPANRLYPRQKTLDEVLELLNEGGIKAEETELREQWPQIWSQDETIGWVYQYFTPKELRDQARKESSAPRNSYELAFRNQFFTPRYVVEFLTDNTLGRIWYEMRKGDTKLKDQCRYMVRRPTEVFLKEGEKPPKDGAEGKNDLSQEELLKLPVHIPHRPKKDPRELKILDPACGSGHFLLYCFDLLLTIYEEAYADPDLGPALKQDYPTLDALKRDVPRLILAHNLHGIDIDLRASQIAALALWLRCQRAYQDMGLKKDRPKITRSNFVCAEPMPGEEQMLKEFVGQLEPKVLGQVVEVVFDKMKLAGEAGSLLKIEEEIRDAIREAKRQYAIGGISVQRTLFDKPSEPVVKVFSVKDITDAQFFEEAESKVIEALRSYAEKAQNGQRLKRRLFSEDAVRGFAFVDLCQKQYDVLLMNPPFGLFPEHVFEWAKQNYWGGHNDIYGAFVLRTVSLSHVNGLVGAISSNSFLRGKQLEELRTNTLQDTLSLVCDLGLGVMDDAWVESAAYILTKSPNPKIFFIDMRDESIKGDALIELLTNPAHTQEKVFAHARTAFASAPRNSFLYDMDSEQLRLVGSTESFDPLACTARSGLRTFDNDRFVRLWWECKANDIGESHRWVFFSKGGEFELFYQPLTLVVHWGPDGTELMQKNREVNGQTAQARQGSALYFRRGLTFPSRSELGFCARVFPAGCIFSSNGPVIVPNEGMHPPLLAGLFNSSRIRQLIDSQSHRRSYSPGLIRRINWVDLPPSIEAVVTEAASAAISAKADMYSTDETCPEFGMPLWMMATEPPEAINQIGQLATDQITGASSAVIRSLEQIDSTLSPFYGAADSGENVDRMNMTWGTDALSVTHQVMSYCCGSVFGRWDVRKAKVHERKQRRMGEFDSYPSCPAGMLPVMDSSAVPESTVGYPLSIALDGIVPDDVEQTNDIVRRVREVLELIWKDRADDIEKEACEILGVKELRDYFRKSGKGGFWDDHISRYSKSRRKAPIYWLIQSSKKNYAIWLYYHRLDKDVLFKALVNYVEPKIRLETSRLESFRLQKAAAGESGKEAKRLAKDVERQEDFLSELRDFEDKLRRAANLHLEPDLNDGVVLNIAPLWELVPWKEAKSYWDELLKGEYEWSSIGKQLRQKGLVK